MRISLIGILLVFCCSCQEYDPHLNSVRLYGHGGSGFDNVNSKYAPNSVSSLRDALDHYELDGIEVDVQFTNDAGLLVFHDVFMENATQCKGRVNSIDLVDAKGCYYRGQYFNSYEDQVISFDSLISLMNTVWTSKYLSINIQSNFDVPYDIDSLAVYFHEKLSGFNNLDKINIECNDANFLYFLESEDSTYQSYLIAKINRQGADEVYRFGLDGIVSPFDSRDEQIEKELSDSGYVIMLYGAKLASNYSDYDYKYITAVQVDNPILALNYFKRD